MSFTFTATTSYPVTVEQVYGCVPEIPQGYEAIAFRMRQDGEMFVPSHREGMQGGPRLILRKKTRKRYVYTLADGEQPRQAVNGQYYSSHSEANGLGIYFWGFGSQSVDKVFIYTREVIEE